MSKRIWDGFYLTPWLLASTGCSTFPFVNTASTPLPTERRLSIAQTFERQGHTDQARALYEQIAASEDPASGVAAQRLESLIAKQTRKGSNQSGHRRQFPMLPTPETSIAKRGSLQRTDPQTAAADSVSSSAESLQRVTATASAPSASDSWEDTELHAATHEVAEIAAASRRTPPLPAPVEIPPSPQVTRVGDDEELPSTGDDAGEDVEWELPTRITRETGESASEDAIVDESQELEKETVPTEEETQPESVPLEVAEPMLADATPAPAAASTETASPDEAATPSSPDLSSLTVETPSPAEAPAIGVRLRANARLPVSNGQPSESARRSIDQIPENVRFLFGSFKPEMIGELSKNRTKYQDTLLAVAMDPNVEHLHRSRAIFLLGHLGADAGDAVNGLRRVMRSDRTNALRIETAEAVLSIEPTNEEAVRFLLEMLKNEDPEARWYAAFALRLASSAHPDYVNFAVNRLLESIDSGDVRYRRMAMLSLGAFGTSAEKAVPRLTAALEDPDEITRVIAANSLKLINPPPATPQLVSQRTDGAINERE